MILTQKEKDCLLANIRLLGEAVCWAIGVAPERSASFEN